MRPSALLFHIGDECGLNRGLHKAAFTVGYSKLTLNKILNFDNSTQGYQKLRKEHLSAKDKSVYKAISTSDV